MFSGCVEEGAEELARIEAEVGDCPRCWRDIANTLASKVACMMDRYEFDTMFQTLDNEIGRYRPTQESIENAENARP
jgi:hypothetical protein